MPRYIDAEIFGFIHFKDRPDKTYADGIQRVMAFVDSLPSADVRENVHGEWIVAEDGMIHCTACKKIPTNKIMDRVKTLYYINPLNMNFCPNCGADMR